MKKKAIEEFENINDIQQYFLHYPTDSQYVVLYLHGGPGQTEIFFSHLMIPQDAPCNYVFYDQRGTGRTQKKNKSKYWDISFEILISDLRDIIKCIKNKYRTDKIILLGHSWGTVLGTEYVKRYPEDVIAYIGMGQIVNLNKGAIATYEKLGEVIRNSGIEPDFLKYKSIKDYPNKMTKEESHTYSKLIKKYGMSFNFGKVLRKVIRSPYFKLSDILPYLSGMTTNKCLFEFIHNYDTSDFFDYKIPVFYICGERDWSVPSVVAADYFEKIIAPQKKIFWIKDAGHIVNIDNPIEYTKAIDEIICML